MQFLNLPVEFQFLFIFSAIAWNEVSASRIKSHSTNRFVSQYNPRIKQYFFEFPFVEQVEDKR